MTGIARSPASHTTDLRVAGRAVVYRLYDVGGGIDLEHATRLLGPRAVGRPLPSRGEAQALVIPNPPLTADLGARTIEGADRPYAAALGARLFDFGALSLRLEIPADSELDWAAFTRFGNAIDSGIDLSAFFAAELEALLAVVRPAIDRPALAGVSEDYIVFRLDRLRDVSGTPWPVERLGASDVAPLLLGEHRPLAESARRDLLPHRLSYTTEDLVVLTWDNALVIEPDATDADVEYMIEFANAQLLELRHYDALLDRELPRVRTRLESARGGIARLFRRHRRLLADLQGRMADFTDILERVENALKVTDDVHLARVYAAALELFRGRVWREGIDRKLAILRDAYEGLNDDAIAARAEWLEMTIIILILSEIALAFLVRP